MLAKAGFAGLAALFLFTAATAAQTTSPTPPSDQSAPLNSKTPSGAPYSESGSGLPTDPSDRPVTHRSSSASDNAADSAAQTRGGDEEKAIDRCKGLPHEQAMRDKACAALIKQHPTMMNDPE